MVLVEKKAGFMSRSRMDNIAGILRVSREGAQKTRITHLCDLSFRQLKAYLDFLANSGLVREISKSGSSVFETTDKGAAFLQAYDALKVLHSE